MTTFPGLPGDPRYDPYATPAEQQRLSQQQPPPPPPNIPPAPRLAPRNPETFLDPNMLSDSPSTGGLILLLQRHHAELTPLQLHEHRMMHQQFAGNSASSQGPPPPTPMEELIASPRAQELVLRYQLSVAQESGNRNGGEGNISREGQQQQRAGFNLGSSNRSGSTLWASRESAPLYPIAADTGTPSIWSQQANVPRSESTPSSPPADATPGELVEHYINEARRLGALERRRRRGRSNQN
ncbi:hypothetical protein ABW19_dt0206904 [Dactylella cylindrospora]|nr:hypothetical protein ABW19_dt0206904 [Dactylella cylindrospora]